ncbi:hypothetical protein CPB84DRAFT_1829545 [Gymnopilus junonius]|uniref:Uncharacterized protein n=1 Tax=Gymnopilus junonius TaxID=109634 RepID=A0A9P5N8E0_GYMJU|nr:hypothetical protein CPB84DRAFT_1829545 [Gymnopilus junonius]
MDLSLRELTLSEFCATAKTLLQTSTRHDFIRFVLNGELDGEQVIVNPLRDHLRNGDHTFIHAVRDFDSLLGIDADVRVHADLTLNVIGKNEDVLRSNIHIKHSWDEYTAPVHKIPNIGIGKWGVHTLLRVLIPGLYRENGSPMISEENRRIFYEDGLYPAIRTMMRARGTDWPATFQGEVFRAQGANGRLALQTKILPEHLVPFLGDTLRQELFNRGIPWAGSIVFLHQVRGVKNGTAHHLSEASINRAFTKFLSDNDLVFQEVIANGRWCLDVGLELESRRDECVVWRTDGHRNVVGRILDIDEVHADKITRLTSGKYTRDMTSHMPSVSGCRVVPGAREQGPFEARYLQLYMTDKSVTARKDKTHHGKFIDGAAILAGKGVEYIEKLYDLYSTSATVVQAHARAEVRVDIKHYGSPFRNFSAGLIERSLLTFPRNVWWGLRAYRALAYQYLLHEMENAKASLRAQDPALLLAASAPWFLNSLHCTPDLGQSHRDLLTAILPHIARTGADINVLPFAISTRRRQPRDDESEPDEDFDEDDVDSDEEYERERPRHIIPNGDSVPSIIHGMVFLRRLRLGPQHPCPRLERGLFIKDATFKYIFKKDIDDVREVLYNNTMIAKPNADRVMNKTRRTLAYLPPDDEQPIFNLEVKGYHLVPPPADQGSDNEPSDSDDEVREAISESLDMELTVVWRQFLLDITARAPNMKGAGNPSYVKLTASERLEVNEATYQDPDLSKYFNYCQWRMGSEDDWKRVFNHLWPVHDDVKFNAQNYGQCRYYLKWGTLLDQFKDEKTERKARRALWRRYDKLYWVPLSERDKLWWTKAESSKFSTSDITGERKVAPRILVRYPPRPIAW